ncbi:MAG TPA: DUF2294 domain-containing protein [Solirubrobacteraceae bacterium]|nr:DUF2294 domain-containing protein [Solirubrobacteraceae bacterium]
MDVQRQRVTLADPPPASPTTSGAVAADISNAVVRLVREHFGKGPTQAKTVVHDDMVVTMMRGGFTHAEKTLYRAGKGDVVDEGRRAMQEVFQREMSAAIEQLTGRRVEAFLSANHHDPDITVEMFVLTPGDAATNGSRPPEVDERRAG